MSVWQVSHAQNYQFSTNFNGLFAIHFVSISAFVKQIKITKMGELKFSMYFKWQIAVGIEYDGQIIIRVPFITSHISLSKNAKGFEIFGWYR